MSNSTPLKPLIDKLLRAYGYQDQLDEIAIVEAYDEIVGPVFSKHTTNIYFKKKTLFIKLDSSTLKQELSYAKEAIKEKLNQTVGRRIVEQIDIK